MKKLLALLLLLNLSYALWEYFTEEPLPATRISTVEGVLPIFTLSEVQSTPNVQVATKVSMDNGFEQGSLLGGFEDKNITARLLQRMLSLNISGKLVERNETISTDYQVYMQAGESRRLALRKVDELASKGIDATIVERKELADFIMVFGSYTAEHAAYIRVNEVGRHGYPVEVSEVERTSRTYWVEVDADSLRLLDEQVVSVLRRDFIGLKQN